LKSSRPLFFQIVFLVIFLLFSGTQLFSASKAMELYKASRYQEAVDQALQEIAQDGKNVDNYVGLLWSLLELKRYDSAAVYAARARLVNRYDPRIVQAYAQAMYHIGRNEDALRLFQEYVRLAPEGANIDLAYYYMGELYLRFGQFRHADIALTMAIRYQPENSMWWIRLGYAREQGRDSNAAINAYSRGLELSPQSQTAKAGLERLLGNLR